MLVFRVSKTRTNPDIDMTLPLPNRTHCIYSLGLLSLFVLLAIAQPLQAQRVSLDKVIAVVDEGVILQSELDARMAEIVANARAANQQLPPMDEIRQQVLDQLILENIQMQMAERANIRFDDDTLNRVLGTLAEQSNMNFDDYVSALNEQGVYRQTREQVRRELTLRELQRGIVNRRINITDQEIENFLNSEMGRTTMAPDYLVDHMLVAINETDSPAVINAKLEFASSLVAQVQDTGDFISTRSRAQQTGPFEVSGSNFGWRRQEALPSLFTDIVPGMSVGDVEGPIRAGNGFHIITLADIRGGTNRIVDQSHIRHIMVAPNEIRTEEQALQLITRLRERILAGESFETIARQNSDDASSVVAGGDLDWVDDRGALPPEFEQVIGQLEVGELSEPFRTSGGWHIAEVLERRQQDLSREFSRSRALDTLRQRKFDLELQNWMIEIREQAFVEYKE